MFQEAARVLRPGGVAIITVPWASPFRRWKRGRPAAPPPGAVFYQYHFGREELEQNLVAAGFEPIAFATYSPLKTLRDELLPPPAEASPAKEKPVKENNENTRRPEDGSVSPSFRRRLLWQTHHVLLENPVMRAVAGHMILAAARKR